MAFHSKDGSTARSARTHRRERESILGLSGWLFADLLLAIAVIFLVVETKATAIDKGSTPTTTTTSTVAPPPAENVGLIADLDQQLFVTILGGARVSSEAGLRNVLTSRDTQMYLGEKNRRATSWEKLESEGYRVGLIMWFAYTTDLSKSTARRGIPNLVKFLIAKELISADQIVDKNYAEFPNIANYRDTSIGKNDLKFRVFLFKTMQ